MAHLRNKLYCTLPTTDGSSAQKGCSITVGSEELLVLKPGRLRKKGEELNTTLNTRKIEKIKIPDFYKIQAQSQ